MSDLNSSAPFLVGDTVRVGGRSKHRGKVGCVRKICSVKIGVKIPGVDGLLYYMPKSLEKQGKDSEKPKPTCGNPGLLKHDKRVGEAFLSGYNLLETLAEGRSKPESYSIINSLLRAWKDSSESIVGGRR